MHCRVGIELPTIEVRYEQLMVEAEVIAAGRALPTLWNAATNFLQVNYQLLFPDDEHSPLHPLETTSLLLFQYSIFIKSTCLN